MHAQDREKALENTVSVFESKFPGYQAERINDSIYYNPMGKYNVKYTLDGFIFYHAQELIFVE